MGEGWAGQVLVPMCCCSGCDSIGEAPELVTRERVAIDIAPPTDPTSKTSAKTTISANVTKTTSHSYWADTSMAPKERASPSRQLWAIETIHKYHKITQNELLQKKTLQKLFVKFMKIFQFNH
jgi:hypothetical protein